MVEKMRRQSRLESVVIGVCLLTILGLSFFYLYLRSTFRGEAPQPGDGAHILMLVPRLEDDELSLIHISEPTRH